MDTTTNNTNDHDEWIDDQDNDDTNNNNKDTVNNWSIGTYVRIRPSTKKNKGHH